MPLRGQRCAYTLLPCQLRATFSAVWRFYDGNDSCVLCCRHIHTHTHANYTLIHVRLQSLLGTIVIARRTTRLRMLSARRSAAHLRWRAASYIQMQPHILKPFRNVLQMYAHASKHSLHHRASRTARRATPRWRLKLWHKCKNIVEKL